ncbi:hypothetical protein [Agrobacterium sp.]|jgi:hypothetical protein|uniref:hypothetical protein n=1 Tax=Agrobacterium sp. TaxID=361 RepID=UPI0028AF750B
MQEVTRLVFRLFCAVGFFMLAMMVVAQIVAPPESDASSHLLEKGLYSLDQRAVWTTEPVKVQRREPDIPLIDEFPYKFRAQFNMKIHDSASFSTDEGIFLLENVVGIPSRKICIDKSGQRNACGAKASVVLRNILARKFVECRRTSIALRTWLVDCRINGRSVSDMLLEKNAVTPLERAAAGSPK